MMQVVGYEFLRQTLAPAAFAFTPVARRAAVATVTLNGDSLLIPTTVAPANDAPLTHLLFALKHEGTNLQILAQVLPLVDDSAMLAALALSPTGANLRVLCYLWECFGGQSLNTPPVPRSCATARVFDPKRYLTIDRPRDAKWHVSFNGLGTLAYCPSVRRTAALAQGLAADTLGKTADFAAKLSPQLLHRAVEWAYLHETESSFAIEREAPSQQKALAFVQLLQQAHSLALRPDLSEADWVTLQNTVISNPLLHAMEYRNEQNWLRGPGRGALAVTYVPPAPQQVPELMQALTHNLMEMLARSNSKKTNQNIDIATAIDPIVAAAVSAFGFVYIHPFMDGNGRLSRFLFHHVLCQSGRLGKDLMLPVSVAMQRNETAYLACLQTFSKPARALWQVRWIDEGQYDFEWHGHDSCYRFWDATACAEFGLEMAAQALTVELQQEMVFLARYDAVVAAVNAEYDLRSNDLSTLVRCALEQGGKLSRHRRKQFASHVPAAALDCIEHHASAAMQLQR
jgi:Fic/DOC family